MNRSYIGDSSDVDLLWASIPVNSTYIQRKPGDGWLTVEEYRDMLASKGTVPPTFTCKAAANWLRDLAAVGTLEQSFMLRDGTRVRIYRPVTTLLVQTPTGPKPVRSKKRKRAVKKSAVKGKNK